MNKTEQKSELLTDFEKLQSMILRDKRFNVRKDFSLYNYLACVYKQILKLENSHPDLLDACEKAVSMLHNNTEWIVEGGFSANSLVARAETIIDIEHVITKAKS